MTLTTPVKAASGLALTSAGVAGSALAYKYATGLYAIEKVAIDESDWKVSLLEPSGDTVTSPSTLKVLISKELTNSTSKHGIAKGTWKCEIITSSISKEDFSVKKSNFKNFLNKYFPGYSSVSTEGTTFSIGSKNRENFVNNCSGNRKANTKQSDEQVISEIKIDGSKIDSELDLLFGKVLNSVETKVYSLTDLTFTAKEFSFSTTANPKLVRSEITITNAQDKNVLDSGDTWTCTIEGIPSSGTTLANSDVVTELKTKLDDKLKQDQDKRGLINSCARNRTSDFENKKVTSTLKLGVSKSGDNKLKFDENHINKVFGGTWINPKE